MKDTLNVGLVGYKFMGKAHSNAFKKVNMFLIKPENCYESHMRQRRRMG